MEKGRVKRVMANPGCLNCEKNGKKVKNHECTGVLRPRDMTTDKRVISRENL